MNRETKEATVKIYDQSIAGLKSERSLITGNQEFGKRSLASGTWEDLKPREIARLDEKIAEYEILRRETATISI